MYMSQREVLGDARGVSACCFAVIDGEYRLVLGRGAWLEVYSVCDSTLVRRTSVGVAARVVALGAVDRGFIDATSSENDDAYVVASTKCGKVSLCDLSDTMDGARPLRLWSLAHESKDNEEKANTDEENGLDGSVQTECSWGDRGRALVLCGRRLGVIDITARLTNSTNENDEHSESAKEIFRHLSYQSHLMVMCLDAQADAGVVVLRDSADSTQSYVQRYDLDTLTTVESSCSGFVFSARLDPTGCRVVCLGPNRISILRFLDKTSVPAMTENTSLKIEYSIALNGLATLEPPGDIPHIENWGIELPITCQVSWVSKNALILVTPSSLWFLGGPGMRLEPLAALATPFSFDCAISIATCPPYMLVASGTEDALLCSFELGTHPATLELEAMRREDKIQSPSLASDDMEHEPNQSTSKVHDDPKKRSVRSMMPLRSRLDEKMDGVMSIHVCDALPVMGAFSDACACPRLDWNWDFKHYLSNSKSQAASRKQRRLFRDKAMLGCAGSNLVHIARGIRLNPIWSLEDVSCATATDDGLLQVVRKSSRAVELYRLHPTVFLDKSQPSNVHVEQQYLQRNNGKTILIAENETADTLYIEFNGVVGDLILRAGEILDAATGTLLLPGPYATACAVFEDEQQPRLCCVSRIGVVELWLLPEWVIEYTSTASVLDHPFSLDGSPETQAQNKQNEDAEMADIPPEQDLVEQPMDTSKIDFSNEEDAEEIIRAAGFAMLCDRLHSRDGALGEVRVPCLAVLTSLSLRLYNLKSRRRLAHGFPLYAGTDGTATITTCFELQSRTCLIVNTSTRCGIVLSDRGFVKVIDLLPSSMNAIVPLPIVRGLAYLNDDTLHIASGLGSALHISSDGAVFHRLPLGGTAKRLMYLPPAVAARGKKNSGDSPLLAENGDAGSETSPTAAPLAVILVAVPPLVNTQAPLHADVLLKQRTIGDDGVLSGNQEMKDDASSSIDNAPTLPVEILAAGPVPLARSWVNASRDEVRVVDLDVGRITQKCILLPGETAACLSAVRLGDRLHVAIGTCGRRTENAMFQGRLLVLDRSPTRSSTLHLVASRQCLAAVTAICSIDNRFVVIASGSRIEIYEPVYENRNKGTDNTDSRYDSFSGAKQTDENEVNDLLTFRQVAQHHSHGGLAVQLIPIQHYILALDTYRGLRLLYWRRRDKLLIDVAKDDEHLDLMTRYHSTCNAVIDQRSSGKLAVLICTAQFDKPYLALVEYAPLRAGTIRVSKVLRRHFQIGLHAATIALPRIAPNVYAAVDGDGAASLLFLGSPIEATFRSLLSVQRLLFQVARSPMGFNPDTHLFQNRHHALLNANFLLHNFQNLSRRTQADIAAAVASTRPRLYAAMTELDFNAT